jgi:hypothetical protein
VRSLIRWFQVFATAALVLFGNANAEATLIVLQPDGSVGKDANIRRANGDVNFGNSTTLMGGVGSIALLEFDLSILTGATIHSATLSLYHANNTQLTAVQFDIFRITSAWDEATVTFNTAPTFDPSAVSTLAFAGGVSVFRHWDIGALVQTWASGDAANYGMWIEEFQSDNTLTAGFSSSDIFASRRPILTIDYTEAAPVPEPATLPLLGVGLVVVYRMRRTTRR